MGMGGIQVGKRRFQTEADIDRAIRSGYGQEAGLAYRPWLRVRDVPSRGQSKKTLGIKVPRKYEFFSQNEYFYFLTLEFSQSIIDIREQFPLLPTSETVEAASSLGYAHPKFPGTGLDYVMTTDFLITKLNSVGEEVYYARTVKDECEFEGEKSGRVAEKLEIERLVWERRGVDWKVVLKETLFETCFARNLQWLKKNANVERDLQSYPVQRRFLLELYKYSGAGLTIEQALREVSKETFVSLPDCRRLYQNLLWRKVMKIDLESKLLDWPISLPEFEFDLTAEFTQPEKMEALP